jgi:opacity protein-like surface antigen
MEDEMGSARAILVVGLFLAGIGTEAKAANATEGSDQAGAREQKSGQPKVGGAAGKGGAKGALGDKAKGPRKAKKGEKDSLPQRNHPGKAPKVGVPKRNADEQAPKATLPMAQGNGPRVGGGQEPRGTRPSSNTSLKGETKSGLSGPLPGTNKPDRHLMGSAAETPAASTDRPSSDGSGAPKHHLRPRPAPRAHPRKNMESETMHKSHSSGGFQPSLQVGARVGTLSSKDVEGERSSDLGLGVAAGLRLLPAVGLEVAYLHHDDAWSLENEVGTRGETARTADLLSASVRLYSNPRSPLSPYFVGGVTYEQLAVQQPGLTLDDNWNGSRTGGHAGLGLELSVGKVLTFDIEGRLIAAPRQDETDPTAPVQAQAFAGLNLVF